MLKPQYDEVIIEGLKKGLLKAEQDGVGEITWEQYQALVAEDFERTDISLSVGKAMVN